MSDRLIVLYCGLLMTIGAFSIDITLPSFPAMEREFATSPDVIKLTVTVYLAAIGVGQLLWGAASDCFGRRKMLRWGLGIFFVGGILSVLAPNISTLLAARILQGLGGAAGVVVSRAIIRDLFSGRELASNMALAMAVFAAGPIVAPLLGASVAAVSNWRMVFAVVAVFAALLWLVARFGLPETAPKLTSEALRPGVLLSRARRVLGHPQSRFFVFLSATIMSMIIFIVASVPTLYEREYGVTGMTFAVLFALLGFGIIVGQMANRRLITILGTETALGAAAIVLLMATGSMLALALAGMLDVVAATALLVLFSTSYLIVYANAASLVLDPRGEIAGFAASFYGFASQIGAALIVSAVSFAIGEGALDWAAVLFGLCAFNAAAIFWWTRFGRRSVDADLAA